MTQASQITVDDEYSNLPQLSMMSISSNNNTTTTNPLNDHQSQQQSQQQHHMPDYLSFPIASINLCRDLLHSSAVCCPAAYLGRTMDLLCGADTVLAVYDRIEGATANIDSLGAASTASTAFATSSAPALSTSSSANEAVNIVSAGLFAR